MCIYVIESKKLPAFCRVAICPGDGIENLCIRFRKLLEGWSKSIRLCHYMGHRLAQLKNLIVVLTHDVNSPKHYNF